MHTDSELIDHERYSSDIAYQRYRANLEAKGPPLKIGNHKSYADFLEDQIINGKCSRPPRLPAPVPVRKTFQLQSAR